ncbi:MAG TPA: hypothetical protein DCF96_02140 [Rhodobacteraceae bacterium]|nr:hypothetical protein [Paracoccaceae bacterium]
MVVCLSFLVLRFLNITVDQFRWGGAHFLSAKELGDVDFRPAKMKPMVIESLSSASSNLTYFPLGVRET